MLDFFKKHQTLSVFLLYLFFGIIFTLPVIFLISQNFAIDLEKFQEFGKFFEKVKEFQSGGLGEFTVRPDKIFSLYFIFYLFHLVFGEPLGFNIFWILLFFFGALSGYYFVIRFIANVRNDAVRDDAVSSHPASNSITIVAPILPGIFFGLFSLYFPVTPILLFFLFCLFKFLEKLRVKFAIPALILFLVSVNYSLFIGISTLFVVLIIIAFWIFTKLKISRNNFAQNKIFFIKTVILLILFILIFSAKYYLPLKKVEPFSLNEPIFLEQSLDVGFLTKPILNYIGSQLQTVAFITQTLVVLIITVFCLGFFIFAWYNRKKNLMISLAFFLVFLFLVLSLGPYLRFGDNFYQPKIPLPYLALYYYFPFFNQTLEISGFLVYFWIFLILSVCFGLYYLFTVRYSEAMARIISWPSIDGVIIILATLFIFWFFWHPGGQVSSFYTNLDKNKDQFKVLYIGSQEDGKVYLYENSLHSKSLIAKDGMFLDNFEYKFEKDNATQFIANYLSKDNKTISSNFIKKDDKFSAYLKDSSIKYIIFDNKFLNETKEKFIKISENEWEEKKSENLLKFRKLLKFLKENTNGKWQVVGDKIVYEIAPQVKEDITIYEGDNWGKKDLDQRVLIEEKSKEYLKERWALQDAEIILENSSPNSKNVELFFRSRSQNELQKLEVYLNENKVSEFIVSPLLKAYVATLNNIKPGRNIVKFRILDYDGRYLDNINELTKQNSVQFSEIKYQEVNNETWLKFYKNLNFDDNSKILFLPAEIDKLQNNKNILSYKDLIDEQGKKISSIPLLDKLYFDDLNLKTTLDVTNRDYYYQIAQEAIARYNIKFIAIDKGWFDEDEFSNLAKFILSNFDIENAPYNDDRIVVLKIAQKDWQKQISFEFEENWSINTWEKRTDRFFNVAFDEARITVFNPENNDVDAKLSFKIKNFQGEKRKIKVYLNEDWLDEKVLQEFDILPMKLGDEKYVIIELPSLRPQENDVMVKIFKEDGKEAVINKEIGIRMSDFKIERIGAPIKKEIAKDIDYCSKQYKPIFEKYNFKKEFFDGFEDQEYTKTNWINKSWELIFNQNDSYYSKQSLLFANQHGLIIKNINGCFNKIEANMVFKILKWNYASDFTFDFMFNNKTENRNHLSFVTPQEMVYFNSKGNRYNFNPEIPLNQWVNLKTIWQNSGTLEVYKNNNLIFKKGDFAKRIPSAFKIQLIGSESKFNEIYFDDFKLNME